jgi:hypothetical protein
VRRIPLTLLVVLVLILVGAGIVAYMYICRGPNLIITGDAQRKDFRSVFLGEYCDSLSRIRVRDMTSGSVVVWEATTNSKRGFCDFSLSQGDNPALLEGLSKVVVPTNQTTFNLSRGRKYEVTVWRRDSKSSCGSTSQSFEFGGQD